MNKYTTDELQEAVQPIASLVSKSEKAQQKLAPGTWQHTMLQENLKALRLVSGLMTKETKALKIRRTDLQEALRTVESMRSRTEKTKLSPGTPQHTLQRNRGKALRIGEMLIKEELARGL